jgi:integral membrane sensor domain MASE1
MSELTLADRLRRCPSPLKALLIVLAVGAAHGLGSWFIVIFRGEPLYVIWPGVGVGLVALHLFGRAHWPWLLVGSVAVQAVSNGNLGLYTWLFPVVDTLESWVAVTLLARGGVDVTFPRVRDVGRYAVLAAIVPTLLGASLGLSAAVLSGDAYYRAPITWLHWWLADLQGMLHPATVLFTWIYPPPEGARRWRPSTLWPAMAAVVAASAIVGATPAASPFAPALYMLPVAVVLATTVGHGPRGATVTSLLATVTLVTALSGDSGDQTLAINRYAGIEVASLGLLLIALAVAGLLAELAASSRAREAMAAQLAESTRLDALGRVAAGVAHDFNNLLTVILGNASLLRLLTADGRSQQLLLEVETTSQRAASCAARC